VREAAIVAHISSDNIAAVKAYLIGDYERALHGFEQIRWGSEEFVREAPGFLELLTDWEGHLVGNHEDTGRRQPRHILRLDLSIHQLKLTHGRTLLACGLISQVADSLLWSPDAHYE
jgi:hypothetical protein